MAASERLSVTGRDECLTDPQRGQCFLDVVERCLRKRSRCSTSALSLGRERPAARAEHDVRAGQALRPECPSDSG